MTKAEKRKIYMAEYNASPRGKLRNAKYQASKKCKLTKANYRKTTKGRLVQIKGSAKYHAKNPEEFTLNGMLRRCHDPNHDRYELYGGRKENPVKVCDRWRCPEHGLANFIEDKGYRWHPDNEYHRLESDQGYNKKNVVQIRRKLHREIHGGANWIYHDGIVDTQTGWSRRLGGALNLVNNRIKLGWTKLEAITTPLYGKSKRGEEICSQDSQKECLNQSSPEESGLIPVKSIESVAQRIKRIKDCLSSITMTQRTLW